MIFLFFFFIDINYFMGGISKSIYVYRQTKIYLCIYRDIICIFGFSKGMVGFNYVIEMVPDKKYGALDPETGEWNGVVRQILEKVKQNSNSVESSV